MTAFPSSNANAATGINNQVSFQGKVVNSNGTNVANGTYTFVFSIYTVASGGSNIWTETKSLTVTDGIFQTNLGSVTSLPGSVDFNTDNIYLGINFNSDGEMTPRIQFTAAAYTFNSAKLGGLTASQFGQLSPGSAQTGFLNVTGNVTSGATVSAATSLQAPLLDTASAVALNIGTGTASSVTIGRTTTPFLVQGNSSSTFTATNGANTTTVGFTSPTGTNAITFPNAGGTLCTTTSSTCSATYQVAGNYLAKNATDTSSFAVSAANYLYGFTNSNSGVASGVLKLDNGSNTSSTLNVVASGSPSAGNALILANAATGVTGSLIDLQLNSVSKFKVNQNGDLTSASALFNSQTISSAANFTGTVTEAGALTVTAGGASISGGLNNNAGGITNAGAVSGVTTIALNSTISGGTTYTAGTSVQAPLFDTASAVALNIGTGTASSVTVGKATTPFLIQGNSSSTLTATSGANTTTVGFTSPTGTNSILFPNAGGTICTTVASTCNTTYAPYSGTGYLAKNAIETSTVSASGNLLTLTNNSSTAAGVLSLVNSGTNSALSVSASNSPSAGQALIQANAGVGVTGNLIDLQLNAASKFSVNQNGAVVTSSTVNGQTISSAANFTGSVTSASTVSITSGGLSVTAGGISVTAGGLALNNTGITNTGAISGATTIAANNTATLSGTGANELAVTGAPAVNGSLSLVQLGNTISGGNATAGTGGTYLGINEPASGAGSTADFLNFQNNSISKFKVDSGGNVTSGTVNGQTISSAASFTGTISAVTGYQINGAASSGTFLRGNGTNYVSSVLLAADIVAGSTNYIQNQTAITQTADFKISGAGTIGGGLTVTSAASISGGLNNNAGGITNTGAISGATTIAANNTATLSGTGSNELAVTGAPSVSATSSLVQFGNAIAGGNTTAGTGGTYLGINQSGSGAGSTADFINLQNNSVVKFKVDTNGNVTSGTVNGQTVSSAANFTGTLGTAGALTVGAGGASISGGLNNNAGGITNAGAVSGVTTIALNSTISGGTTYTANTSVQAPLFDAASAVALNIGTGTASSVTLGKATTPFLIQGNSSSAFTATSGANTTTVGFTAPTGTNSITFPNAGGILCTTTASTCNTTYQPYSAGGYIAKNTQDVSGASVTGNLLTFTNNASTAAGVLSLVNSGTNSALSVSASNSPSAGQALILANAGVGVTGNLIDLQLNAASKFSVNQNGAVVTSSTVNGQTISSAANFTGSVTSASTVSITSGGLSVTAGGISVTAGGLALNNTGINNTGAISGATTVTATGNTTFGSAGATILTNNGASRFATCDYTGVTGATTLNTASKTPDVCTAFRITTSGAAAITVPAPTAGAGSLVYVSNMSASTNSFTLLGSTVNIGATATLIYNGSAWTYAGADGNSILNQTTAAQASNFWVQSNIGGGVATSAVTAIIKAANTQTGDLLQFQNTGGTPIAKVDINGNLTAVAGTLTGNVTVGTAGTTLFKNNGATANAVCAYAGVTGAVTLNTAGKTPDVCTVFTVTDTAPATITVPTPAAGAGSIVYITNLAASTNTLTILGASLSVGSSATLVYNGTAWSFAGADSSGLQVVYNNSAGAAPSIVENTTNKALTIQSSVASGIASGNELFGVRSAAANDTTLGNSALTVSTSGIGIEIGTAAQNPTVGFDLGIGQIAGAATARTIGVLAQGTAATSGNGLTITAGTGNTSGVGGALSIQGGVGGNAAAGGTATLIGGAAGGGNTNGGAANVQGGVAAGTGTGGTVSIAGGLAAATAGSLGGVVNISGGSGSGTGTGAAGSAVNINGGNAGGTGANNGGAIGLQGGTAASTGTGGAVSIAGGSGSVTTSSTGGTVTIQGGASGAVAGGIVGGVAILGGAASTIGTGGAGGNIALTASNAGGSGNNNGGNIRLTAGTATGTGVPGVVSIDQAVFTNQSTTFTQTANNQSFPGVGVPTVGTFQTYIDSYSTITINMAGAFTGATVTIPAPTNTAAIGRLMYVAAANGSASYTLSSSGMKSIFMSANSTAMLVWNGSYWSGSAAATSLQDVYNNTSSSPAGIITTSATKNILFQAGVGFDNANVFQIGNSSGATIFTVDTTNTANGQNIAINGAAESTFGGEWTANGAATVTRDTTVGEFATGTASVKAATTGASQGARNNLGAALAVSTKYLVSFSVKSSDNWGNTDIAVEYYRNNTPTLDATCSTFSGTYVPTINSTSWIKYSCTFTTSATAGAATDFLAIRQTAAATRSIFIDNLSIVAQNTTGTQDVGALRVGGALSQGLNLLTLDSYAAAPFSGVSPTLLGSMYYDTTQGRIQCYEQDGWGPCGSAPNNSYIMVPEYGSAVLGVGTGADTHIGTMTANMCSGSSRFGIQPTEGTVCASTEEYNYYRWTSGQTAAQTYSIFAKYQLPPTFNNFVDDNTVKIVGRVSSTTDASVSYGLYGNTGTQCGSTTAVASAGANTWYTTSLGGPGETTCGFAAGDIITFKIDMSSKNNAYAYVSNILFTMTGK